MESRTILVVDDEEFVCWSLSQHLTAAGYRVFQATTGVEALLQFRDHAMDLVFLDFKLPDADGLSLLTRMKELDSDTVIILMTGHTSVEQAVAAMKLGVDLLLRGGRLGRARTWTDPGQNFAVHLARAA